MSLSTFTVVHVVLSLVGIASGVLVLLRPSASPKAWGLTTLFLATSLGSPLFLAHLLVLATSVWLAIHAFAYLQPGGASRRIRARALRVADRWN